MERSQQRAARAAVPSARTGGGRRAPAGRARPAARSCSKPLLSTWRPPSRTRPNRGRRSQTLFYSVRAAMICDPGHTLSIFVRSLIYTATYFLGNTALAGLFAANGLRKLRLLESPLALA